MATEISPSEKVVLAFVPFFRRACVNLSPWLNAVDEDERRLIIEAIDALESHPATPVATYEQIRELLYDHDMPCGPMCRGCFLCSLISFAAMPREIAASDFGRFCESVVGILDNINDHPEIFQGPMVETQSTPTVNTPTHNAPNTKGEGQ